MSCCVNNAFKAMGLRPIAFIKKVLHKAESNVVVLEHRHIKDKLIRGIVQAWP